MSKIIYVVTTKNNITFTKNDLGHIYFEGQQSKLQKLANKFYKTRLIFSTLSGAFSYGLFVGRYLEIMKNKYPNFKN